jgi:ActR/RegA family two-component response regulator
MQRGTDAVERSGPRILIVDDDEIISVALYRYLIGLGYAVDLAVDAESGSTLLVQHAYALVVLDAYLTGQLHARALHFIDTIRRSQPEARVLVLTAYGSPVLADYVRGYDRITVVRKPQSIPYLAELIEGFMAGEARPVSSSLDPPK